MTANAREGPKNRLAALMTNSWTKTATQEVGYLRRCHHRTPGNCRCCNIKDRVFPRPSKYPTAQRLDSRSNRGNHSTRCLWRLKGCAPAATRCPILRRPIGVRSLPGAPFTIKYVIHSTQVQGQGSRPSTAHPSTPWLVYGRDKGRGPGWWAICAVLAAPADYRGLLGLAMVRHMCADGLLSYPSPSVGCLK